MQWTNQYRSEKRSKWFVAPPPTTKNIRDAAQWCKQQPGGLFYYHFSNTRWWFQREEDALIFALKWSTT